MVAGICEIFQDRFYRRHLTACSNGVLSAVELVDLDSGWNAGRFYVEVFFSRALWEKVGGHVNDDLYYSMDYELWCRFANAGAKLAVIGTPARIFVVMPRKRLTMNWRSNVNLSLLETSSWQDFKLIFRLSATQDQLE